MYSTRNIALTVDEAVVDLRGGRVRDFHPDARPPHFLHVRCVCVCVCVCHQHNAIVAHVRDMRAGQMFFHCPLPVTFFRVCT